MAVLRRRSQLLKVSSNGAMNQMRRSKPIPADYELSNNFDFAVFDKAAARWQKQSIFYRFCFFLMNHLLANLLYSYLYIIDDTGVYSFTFDRFFSILPISILFTAVMPVPLIIVWLISDRIYNKWFSDIFMPAAFKRQSVLVLAYRHALTEWSDLNLETGEGFWKSLRGVAFEDALARFFQRRGVSVEKTKTTGDGGIDLVLRSGSDLIFVQCKGFAKPVPVAPIREIAGVCSRSHAIPVVAAVNGFTKGAIECARDLNVTLVDTPGIVRMAALDHLDKSSLRAVSSST
jgi:restriction system protein